MKKKNTPYSYSPSYLFKKGSKYGELLLNYNDIFIKISNNGMDSLNEEEKEKFFYGIKDISYYIYGSFFYSVKENYENKQNSEKIISAIYSRYVAFLGGEQYVKDEIGTSILDLAEKSIYYTLGLETYKNRNFKWNPEDSSFGNFLKHSIKIPFSEMIFIKMKEINLFLDLEVTSIDDMHSNNLILEGEEKDLAYQLIKDSGIEKYIPEIIYHKLIGYLSGELEYKELNEADVSYLKKIYEGNN